MKGRIVGKNIWLRDNAGGRVEKEVGRGMNNIKDVWKRHMETYYFIEHFLSLGIELRLLCMISKSLLLAHFPSQCYIFILGLLSFNLEISSNPKTCQLKEKYFVGFSFI